MSEESFGLVSKDARIVEESEAGAMTTDGVFVFGDAVATTESTVEFSTGGFNDSVVVGVPIVAAESTETFLFEPLGFSF